MKNLGEELNMQSLEEVAGGSGAQRSQDLSCFVYRTVSGEPEGDGLTLHRTPQGALIEGICWKKGEAILVHESYRVGSWLYAYRDGTFGYVDSAFVS